MTDELRERVAVLELQHKELTDDHKELVENHKIHQQKEERWQEQQTKILNEIRQDQAKMKGFWGGVVFVFSAIATAIGLFIGKLFEVN